MTAWSSRTSLAEMMFLVGHDEASKGEPLIRPEFLNYAVMGALLADLSIARRIRVSAGCVRGSKDTVGGPGRATDLSAVTADDATGFFIDCVDAQSRGFTVRQWLLDLALEINFRVAQQLVDSGVVRHHRSSRRPGRAPDCYPPISRVAAAAPRLSLARCFQQPNEFDLRTGVLAGLSASVGLHRFVDPGLSQTVVRDILEELMYYMPRDLREIIVAVEKMASSG